MIIIKNDYHYMLKVRFGETSNLQNKVMKNKEQPVYSCFQKIY